MNGEFIPRRPEGNYSLELSPYEARYLSEFLETGQEPSTRYVINHSTTIAQDILAKLKYQPP